MSRSLWFALVFCLVALVGLFVLATPALADTITLSNNTPGSADGSTLARTVTLNPGDLPPGATLLTVRVAIDFDKIDAASSANCGGPTGGGDPWNDEMFFYVTSPAGTRVVLVESENNGGGSGLGETYPYTGVVVYNGPYSVVFDDAAPSAAGPVPLSGTFRPEQPLSGFAGESPFGVWTLTAGDDLVQDPLCFAAFALELKTPGADLVLDKTGPAGAVAGQSIAYTIVVTNNGPSAAPLAEVVDDLPDAVAFVDADIVRSGSGPAGECAYAACQAADVQAGEVLTMTLTGRVDPAVPDGTILTNQASAFADGDPTPDTGDSHTTTVQAVADLQIWKSVVKDEICPGAYGLYEIVVENDGPSDAVNLVVTDVLSDALVYGGGSPECQAAGQVVTCTLDRLPAGERYGFRLGFNIAPTVVDGTAILNTAEVQSDVSAPAVSLPASFEAVQCLLPEADLSVTKTVTDPWTAGTAGEVHVRVTNNGPHAAENVSVLDPAANGITFQGFAAFDASGQPIDGWVCDAGVTCVRANPMPANTTEELVLYETLPPDMVARVGHNARNEAYVVANNPDSDLANNRAEVPYVVDSEPGLWLDKVALASELVAGGEEVLYRILVGNDGPSDAYGVAVTDTLDAGLVLLALEPGPAVPMSCLAGTCVLEVLPAGETAEIDARVRAPAGTAAGSYDNTACAVSELVFDGGPGTGAPPATLGPYAMTAFGPDARPLVDVWDVPSPLGGAVLFDRAMAHRRIGSNWATWSHGYTGDVYFSNGATSVTMSLPPNTGAFYFYVEPNPFDWVAIEATAQDGTTSGEVLAHGSSSARYFGFYSLGGAPLVSITVTSASDFAVGEFGIANHGVGTPYARVCAGATLPVAVEADLAVLQAATPTAVAGEIITYMVAVENLGPSDALTVTVTDTLPAGVTLAAASPACAGSAGVVTCALGDLPTGVEASATITVLVNTDVEPGTSLENVAVAGSATPDPVQTNNRATADTSILAETNLTLVKTGPAAAFAGDTIAYTIVVTNEGPSAAPLVEIVDDLPDEVAFVGAGLTRSGAGPAGGCAYATCQAPDVRAGEVLTMTLTGLVDPATPAGTVLTNQAGALAGTDPAPDATGTAVTTVQGSAVLHVWKSAVKDEICLGAGGLYEIVVANSGPSDAVNLVVTDTLPAELTYSGGSPECQAAGAPNTVTCTLDRLAAGERTAFTISFEIAPGVVAGTAILNTASAASDVSAPVTSQPASVTAAQCSLPQADLEIYKTVEPAEVVAGENVTFTLTITNNGPHAAEGVVVQDLFVEGMDGVDVLADPSLWSCDGGVTCVRRQPMPAGVTDTIAVRLHVPAGVAPGAYANDVWVVADNPDPGTADNRAAVDYTVEAEAILAIAASAMPDPVLAGEALLYQVVMTNTGPSVAYDVVITNSLDYPHVTYAGAGPGCALQGNDTVVCQLGDLWPGAPRATSIAVRVDETLDVGLTPAVTNTARAGAGNGLNVPEVTIQTRVEQSSLNRTDLELAKTAIAWDPVGPNLGGLVANGLVEYALVVTNTGPTTATGVVVHDQLPYGFRLVSAQFSATGYVLDGTQVCQAGVSCSLGDVPVGGVVTITLEVNIPKDPQWILMPTGPQGFPSFGAINTAVVRAANPDPDGLDNWDQVVQTIEPWIDLGVVKESIPAAVVPGEELTYRITVYNNGPSDAQGLFQAVLSDTLPAQLDPSTVSVQSSEGFCQLMGNQVMCLFDVPGSYLGLPKAVDVTIHGRVLPGAAMTGPNPMLNQAQVLTLIPPLGALYDSDLENNVGSAQTSLTPQADLALVKTATPTAVAGGNITYTFAVENLGPSDAMAVTVTDTLPAGVSLVSTAGCADDPAGVPVCALGDLPVGASATYTVVVTTGPGLEPGTSLENQAAVASDTPDPVPGNNRDTADTSIVGLADLALTKTGPATAVAGERIIYTLVVDNLGPSTAQSVVVADALPPGVTLVSLAATNGATCGAPTCSLGDVAAGQAVTLTLVAQTDPGLAEGTLLTNEASALSDSPDGDVANNHNAATTMLSTAADLAVDKADLADPVEPAEGFLYQVNVYNRGASDARDVVVVDTLGTGLTFSTASPGCTGGPGSQAVTCRLDRLGAGERTFFLVAVTAGDVPSGTLLTNDVEVSSATTDPNDADNHDQETTTVHQQSGPSADLAIVKTATPSLVTAGELVTYVLTVTNAGPMAATNVQVLEMIPPETSVVSMVADNPDSRYEFCSAAGVCYLGTVEAGRTVATITAVLRVEAGCQETSLVNVASVTGSQVDPVPDNNLAAATVGVDALAVADLALVKDASATAEAGGTITYTITVWNLGPQVASGLLVTDTLPPGVTLAWADPACSTAAGPLVCAAPSLAAGQAVTFGLAVDVVPGVEPGTSLQNAAVCASPARDPNPSNNADTADTSIVGLADLALSKTGPDSMVEGDMVTYTIAVTNHGPATAQSVDVKDDLPPEIELVSASVQRTGGGPMLCGGLVCQAGDMAVGEVVTVTIVGRVAEDLPDGLWVTNTAAAFCQTEEDNLDNNVDDHPAWVRSFTIYLPVVSRTFASGPLLPDLVASFSLDPDQNQFQPDEPVAITVTVTNQGSSAAGPFWVDFYLNPDPVPTAPNLRWDQACSLSPCYGITWQVAAGLAPGHSVTLTSSPGSYDVTRSLWPGYLAPGTSDLYLYVDSWSPGSPVGAVLEADEGNNRAERHGLIVPNMD